MTEPRIISDTKSRETIFLIWAVVATLFGLLSAGLALLFFLQARGARDGQAGWTRWDKSDGGNGHWYRAVLQPNGVTWAQAEPAARAAGGYLATITSAEENAFVFGLVNTPAFFFSGNGFGPALGGFQSAGSPKPGGGWQWVSGEPWAYANWLPGQPDGSSPGEDYLEFCSAVSGKPAPKWNDIPGDQLLTGYVIERDDDPKGRKQW